MDLLYQAVCLLGLVTCAVVKHDRQRYGIVLISGFSQVAYSLINMATQSPEMAYGAAFLFDMIAICFFAEMAPTKLVLRIILLHVVSLIVHLAGYIIYWLYVPAMFYNGATIILYLAQLLILLQGKDANLKNSLRGVFRNLVYSMGYKHLAKEKAGK